MLYCIDLEQSSQHEWSRPCVRAFPERWMKDTSRLGKPSSQFNLRISHQHLVFQTAMTIRILDQGESEPHFISLKNGPNWVTDVLVVNETRIIARDEQFLHIFDYDIPNRRDKKQ